MIKIVVPVSGGKDSQSCLKLARSLYNKDEIMGLFCDTQWEHPLTYAHIEKLKTLYDVNITTITAGSVPEKVLKYNRFPGFSIRFCTDELKMKPTKEYLKTLGTTQTDSIIEVWYGIRNDESTARKKRYAERINTELYLAHEVFPNKYPKYLSKLGIRFKFPILDWTTEEVYSYLNKEENPLYKQGFNRVGCFPCLATNDKGKRDAFEHDTFGKAQWDKVVWLSSQINKPVYQKEYDTQFNCSICSI